MIAANDGVPDAVLGHLRAVELGSRRDVDRIRTIDREPLEAAEIVQLVANDRPADGAAPAIVLGVRLLEVLLLLEESFLGQAAALEVAEAAAVQLVRPRLGHRIDHRTRGASELGV